MSRAITSRLRHLNGTNDDLVGLGFLVVAFDSIDENVTVLCLDDLHFGFEFLDGANDIFTRDDGVVVRVVELLSKSHFIRAVSRHAPGPIPKYTSKLGSYYAKWNDRRRRTMDLAVRA